MSFRLKVPETQSEELKKLVEIDENKFDQALSVLRSIKKPSLREADIREPLENVLGTEDARRLTRHLIGIAGIQSRIRDASFEEIIETITENLRDFKWDEEKLDKWINLTPKFVKLLSINSIGVVAKAMTLGYEQPNQFSSANIFTDARPVFDINRSEIEGVLITHTLRLNYLCDGRRQSLNIALDENDISLLKELSDQAVVKTRKMKELFERKEITSYVFGPELYDED